MAIKWLDMGAIEWSEGLFIVVNVPGINAPCAAIKSRVNAFVNRTILLVCGYFINPQDNALSTGGNFE